MGMELLQTTSDLLTLHIRGVLSHAEFIKAQERAAELLQKSGPMRILVDGATFTGFARDGDWGDLTLQLSDRLVVKMAIIAHANLKNLILMFCGKGMRKFPIEFFEPSGAIRAREWLNEPVIPNAGQVDT